MEEKPIANASPGQTPPARKRLEFAYDSQSRRIRKVVKSFSSSEETFVVTSDTRFVYDAWNLLAEINVTQNPDTGTFSNHIQRIYAWGYDLSGTEQGAGGVGGLVLVNQPSTTVNNGQPSSTALAPCYDGNGNIHTYLDCATGAITQRMEYDAFGNEMTLDSVLEGGASTNRKVPFRFSTKYTDSETSLSYYGYRYYSAEMGRWLSRDPIEEKGGVNLYIISNNSATNLFDTLGMFPGSGLLGSLIDEVASYCSNLEGKQCDLCCLAIGQLKFALGLLETGLGLTAGAVNPLVAGLVIADGILTMVSSYSSFKNCQKEKCKTCIP